MTQILNIVLWVEHLEVCLLIELVKEKSGLNLQGALPHN
jgi:hypothetical protein